ATTVCSSSSDAATMSLLNPVSFREFRLKPPRDESREPDQYHTTTPACWPGLALHPESLPDGRALRAAHRGHGRGGCVVHIAHTPLAGAGQPGNSICHQAQPDLVQHRGDSVGM